MKLLSTPYRWLPRTFFKNINHWYWDVRNGVQNLFIFFDAVWWFRSFDWSGMVHLLEVSAHQMKDCQLRGSYHVGAERCAKQLLIVEELCKRIRAEEYFRDAGYGDGTKWNRFSDHRQSQIAAHARYMEKQDAEYLGKMMRFVQYWWD